MEGIEFFLRNIGKMIEFEDMDTTVKELESYAKCGKSEIRRLDQYDYGSFGESDELIFYLFDLWIEEAPLRRGDVR